MREIDLVADENKLPINTFLIYGALRTGKTTFLASFPRPLILSDSTEKGWESLIDIPDEHLFEPGVKPIVWAIENTGDIKTQAIPRLKQLIASGRVLTIGIDSATFYAELALATIMGAMTKADNRRAYGDLGAHMRQVRVDLHSLGVNVVWLALVQDPSEDEPLGKPLIAGRAKDQIAGACDYIWYSRVNGTKFEVRTKRYASYLVGHRRGMSDRAMPPDPLVGTYSTFLTELGYDVGALRAALPKIAATPRFSSITVAAPATPPVAAKAAQPPIVIKQVSKAASGGSAPAIVRK